MTDTPLAEAEIATTVQTKEKTVVREANLWVLDEDHPKILTQEQVRARIEGRSEADIAGMILADKKKVSELQGKATIDDMTGLLNKRGFHVRVTEEVLAMARDGESFAVYFMDLNGMKSIDDQLGHEHGNRYIELVGRDLLPNVFRPGDVVAHPHGDEFVALAKNVTPEGAEAIRQRLNEAMKKMIDDMDPSDLLFEAKRRGIALEVAIGVSHLTWTEQEREELKRLVEYRRRAGYEVGLKVAPALGEADIDMYKDKVEKKNKAVQSGSQLSEVRPSVNSLLKHGADVWKRIDPIPEVPTLEQILEDLRGKSKDEIAEAMYEDQVTIEKLQHLLTLDDMTGLLNKTGFRMRAREVVAQLAREGKPFAILVGDMNEMKTVNDDFGHDTGDYYINMQGRAILDVLREYDVASHPYGDEFVMILSDVTPQVAAEIRDRIYARMQDYVRVIPSSDPLAKARAKMQLGGSIGISHVELSQSDLDALKSHERDEVNGTIRDIVIREFMKADHNMKKEKARLKTKQTESE